MFFFITCVPKTVAPKPNMKINWIHFKTTVEEAGYRIDKTRDKAQLSLEMACNLIKPGSFLTKWLRLPWAGLISPTRDQYLNGNWSSSVGESRMLLLWNITSIFVLIFCICFRISAFYRRVLRCSFVTELLLIFTELISLYK